MSDLFISKVEVFSNSEVAYVTKTVREEISKLDAFILISESGIDEEIKTCQNENCGAKFTRQFGTSTHGEYRKKGVKFCSPSCLNAQNMRTKRMRTKQNGLSK